MNFDILSLLALFSAFVLMYGLWFLAKKNVNFSLRTIVAMLLGIILGIIFPNKMDYVAPIGKIYVNLITSVVVPLIFISIFSSIVSMQDISKLRKIGLRAIFLLISNTFIAIIIALFISSILNVGFGLDFDLTEEATSTVPTFSQVIIDLFPSNIISNAANNQIVPIIIFSMIIGVSTIIVSKQNPEIAEPFKNFMFSFQSIINFVITIIFNLTPYAVLALIANNIANAGFANLLPLMNILASTYLACGIQLFIVSSLLILIFAKLNPITFFKKIWSCIVVAFTSQSSMGTLPITTKCLNENVGVNKNITSIVAPLGCSIGMPATNGIWPITLTLTAVYSLNLNYTTTDYLTLILVTLVVSIGSVGVPGAATITTTAIFTTLGLPVEIIVLMTPISAIADMMRTATNVTTCATVTTLVAKSQNQIDTNIFNS